MKRFFYVVAIIAAAAMCASCEKEINFDDSQSANEISFVIGSAATRAEAEAPQETMTAMLPLDIDEESGMSFFLEETVTSLDGIYEPEIATKGTPIYTENSKTALKDFYTVAFTPGSYTTPKLADTEYSYDSGFNSWRGFYTDDPWAGVSGSLWFFMRNDQSIAPTYNVVDGKGTISFSGYTSPATAADQKELVFAARTLTKAEAKNAKVLFYHALTGVKFRISNDSNSTMVTSVKFTGLKNSGSCTVTPYYGSNWSPDSTPYNSSATYKKSDECVEWTLGSTTGTFSQTFETSNKVSYTDDNTFADSFYAAGADKNINKADASLTFWFIPQQLNENVKLEVNYTVGGVEKTSTVDFGKLAKGSNESYPVWAAGELRTYTLKTDDAGITIEDEVESGVKSNVVIKNTGNISEYIRVAVIANWVNAAGDVVAPCNATLTLNSGWSKNANDGFLYLSTAVAPNATATAPFNSYTAPSTKPTGADHLVMDLSVQALDKGTYSTYSAAWQAEAGVEF